MRFDFFSLDKAGYFFLDIIDFIIDRVKKIIEFFFQYVNVIPLPSL